MAEMAGNKGTGIDSLLRVAFWSGAALLLAAPLVAMQLSRDMRWDAGDFIFVAALLGIVGVAFEVTMRMTRSWACRLAVGFAFAAAFLIVVANGAVGMIGDEDNRYNLLFLGVIGLALFGSGIARFRPAGMALAMLVAGAAQAAIAAGGMAADLRGGVFSAVFAGLWLVSAALFHRAAGEQAAG